VCWGLDLKRQKNIVKEDSNRACGTYADFSDVLAPFILDIIYDYGLLALPVPDLRLQTYL
jgi:hypothetical protein